MFDMVKVPKILKCAKINMLTTQDKHNLCCQKVVRASGQSSTGCRWE